MATWDNNNPYMAFLEDVPQAGYFSYQNQFGKSPNQRKYFQNQFQEVQNQYMGQLGQIMRTGGEPTLSFMDYLDQYFSPGGGQSQQWGSMSPRQRGTQRSGFAPSARFRF